ncbi:MAG: hypothetical protein HY790_00330 [Deltaproteobacteria bacterium]|nr:hypothetical protein [Deltaproteobacteria bacterium]MBI4794293.1 hypothetical protein [Deltaproteobacteria bacterium]
MNYAKAFFFWLGFLAVAIAFGVVREKILTPALGPLGGRAGGTLLVCASIFLLIYIYVRKLKDATPNALLSLGIFWTVLTIAFECLFGRYLLGLSWQLILADYNVFQGRLWPLVLLVTLLGPLLAGKMRSYARV